VATTVRTRWSSVRRPSRRVASRRREYSSNEAHHDRTPDVPQRRRDSAHLSMTSCRRLPSSSPPPSLTRQTINISRLRYGRTWQGAQRNDTTPLRTGGGFRPRTRSDKPRSATRRHRRTLYSGAHRPTDRPPQQRQAARTAGTWRQHWPRHHTADVDSLGNVRLRSRAGVALTDRLTCVQRNIEAARRRPLRCMQDRLIIIITGRRRRRRAGGRRPYRYVVPISTGGKDY